MVANRGNGERRRVFFWRGIFGGGFFRKYFLSGFHWERRVLKYEMITTLSKTLFTHDLTHDALCVIIVITRSNVLSMIWVKNNTVKIQTYCSVFSFSASRWASKASFFSFVLPSFLGGDFDTNVDSKKLSLHLLHPNPSSPKLPLLISSPTSSPH